MPKHTPGPWRFYTKPQPNGCPIVGARGLMVSMLAHSINHDDQREEAIANAALIAAAPDLLDALEALKADALLVMNGVMAPFALSLRIEEADSAISKATEPTHEQ